MKATLALSFTLLALLGPSSVSASSHREMSRVEIQLDMKALPPADLGRTNDRLRAIEESIRGPVPLFRSFDPRDSLAETLNVLVDHGVVLDASAVVNFDGLEAWAPSGNRPKIAALPFVRRILTPIEPVPAGLFDSEGIELTRADLAHFAGETGSGVTVAIIDKDYESLANTIADPNDELYAIPVGDMFEQLSSGSSTFINAPLDGKGSREHGTASAEVIYEMAPGATIKLYRVKSVSGIEHAIRHAADQGIDVIHVPLTHIETMADPVGLGAGGTNRFTDDIDYAVAAGSVVIVAAGNEAVRHVRNQYEPCVACVSGGPDYICNDANDDSEYHTFDDIFRVALNELWFDFDHFDAESLEVTCWSAIEEGFDESKFKVRLVSWNDGSPHDDPICPGDSGVVPVSGTERNLGGFFQKTVNLFDADFDENYYFLSVRYTAPTPLPVWPEFRIACGLGVEETLVHNSAGSLSDLAVVASALTVSEIDSFFEDEVSEPSSHGPAGSGGLKPDIAGPGIVENYAVTDFDFVLDWTFNGTSAASAHVGGIVALTQSYLASH
ncbi:MAG: S8 family serine peptidase [Candidatus Binatia bacterium]|nr:S8 family serine peptidase [Candidatus Binatia bacterium]